MEKYTRNCPKCNKEITYKYNKSLNLANRNNKNCFCCSIDEVNSKSRKFNIQYLLGEDNETFYWIGLLLADAYISQDGIELSLHKNDLHILERFQQKIGNPNIYKKGESFRISVRDKKSMSLFNSKFRIIFPKTYNPPDFNNFKDYNIDLLFSMFIGLIDGDGSIYISKKYYTKEISLTFHKNWLPFYTEYLNMLDIHFNISEKGNTLSLRISRKKEIIKIYNKLQKLNINYLERKWDKIKELV